MDPDGAPDLDAIASDLADVEAERDRLANGTHEDDDNAFEPADA